MWFLFALIIAVVLYLILTYNGFVKLKNMAETAWADIEVQLQRRHDLISSIVDAVKGYAKHEREIFEKIAEERSKALKTTSPRARGEREREIDSLLGRIFAIAENYPELKASKNFSELIENLSKVEEALQNARRYYNAVVRDYNIKTETFPSRIVASLFEFKKLELFETEEDVQSPPSINF